MALGTCSAASTHRGLRVNSIMAMATFPRLFGEMNKRTVGYRIRVWLQCAEGEKGELLIDKWARSPTVGYKIIKRLARKNDLRDAWEIVTNLDSVNE